MVSTSAAVTTPERAQTRTSLPIRLTVGGGHIVADADIAPLKGSIQLGELVRDVLGQIKDTPVILAQLLDEFVGNIASFDEFFLEASGYPTQHPSHHSSSPAIA